MLNLNRFSFSVGFRDMIYKIVLLFRQFFDMGQMWPAKECARRALHRTVDYIEDKMPHSISLHSRKELIRYAFSLTVPDTLQKGLYLEFGVFSGGTIKWMAKMNPTLTFHGFDSFEGLPKQWGGTFATKETFDLKGRLPKVPRNVILYKGWFHQTLPTFCKNNDAPVTFIHIDCDLYESTKEIFDYLKHKIKAGTLILFDEYFNYAHWEHGEFKAWKEFVSDYHIKYDYLAYFYCQVLVRVTEISA